MGDTYIDDLTMVAVGLTTLWLAAAGAVAVLRPFGRRTPFADSATMMGRLLAPNLIVPVIHSFVVGAP